MFQQRRDGDYPSLFCRGTIPAAEAFYTEDYILRYNMTNCPKNSYEFFGLKVASICKIYYNFDV